MNIFFKFLSQIHLVKCSGCRKYSIFFFKKFNFYVIIELMMSNYDMLRSEGSTVMNVGVRIIFLEIIVQTLINK